MEVCLADADGDGVCDEFEAESACGDVDACNYVVIPTTTDVDNDLCTYSEAGYDCNGVCLADADGDGVCDEFEVVGCQEATADNYNSEATDAGACEYLGCNNPNACNFDASANTNDGSCDFPIQYRDCEENCLNDFDNDGVCDEVEIIGCTYEWAVNYNPNATNDDGSCVPVEGCTYEWAFNYDDHANFDDGSCYPIIYGCMDPTMFNYSNTGDVFTDVNTDDGSCIAVVTGCIDNTACELWTLLQIQMMVHVTIMT